MTRIFRRWLPSASTTAEIIDGPTNTTHLITSTPAPSPLSSVLQTESPKKRPLVSLAPIKLFPSIRLSLNRYIYAVRGGGKQTDLNDWTRSACRGGASRSAALVSVSSAATQAWFAWFCVLLFPSGQGRPTRFVHSLNSRVKVRCTRGCMRSAIGCERLGTDE